MSMRQLVISKSVTNRESESLKKYLGEISKVNLLSPDDEIHLFSLIQSGDEKAFERLIKANLKFVVSVAKQYQSQGLSLSDLINEGNCGLMKAARHFDATKGFKFISYAVWWIRQYILQGLQENGRLVRMPSNKILLSRQILKTKGSLEQELGRHASEEEIAEAMHMDVKKLNLILANNINHVSFDSPMGEDAENTLLDTIENPNAEIADKKVNYTESLRADIERSLGTLTKMQKQIMFLLFGLGLNDPINLEQIAEMLSLSRERIRQIRDQALTKLREKESSHLLRRYLCA
jgi:RNA polymerase primary sigma factor